MIVVAAQIFEPRHEKVHSANLNTKAQITFAVNAKLISAFVFAVHG